MDVINLESGAIETVDAIDFFRKYQNEIIKINEIISIYKDERLEEANVMTDYKSEDIVITFSYLFNKTDFLEKMKNVMNILENKIGIPVDVEFASDGEKLYILQCRPQSQALDIDRKPIPKKLDRDNIIFYANKYVTTGQIENIEYIVYVVPEEYSNLDSREEMQKISIIINELNNKLPKNKFILIGPGRWGSRGDIKLGVPVKYADINNTSLLVEIAKEKGGYTPELSFGTHFFQDLVESNIKYLPLYPDQKENKFNEELLLNIKNNLKEISPKYANYEKIIKVIKTKDIITDGTMHIIMDGEANEAIGYLKPPDHWYWRMQKVNEIAEKIDPEIYGIEALFLIGSTKTGEAGPGSDIDLIVHFNGTEEQKEKLINWFEERGKRIDEENKKRTGIETGNLLDVHLITDSDITKKTSWATHIINPYSKVKKIPLKKDENN
jgi:predicted nucleotidyltransferase